MDEVEEMDEEALPEDCSIFLNISNRPDNVSSDNIVLDSTLEESFSEFSDAVPGEITSTPSNSRRSTRIRGLSPAPSPPRSRAGVSAASNESPSRNTRSASRAAAASPILTASTSRGTATGSSATSTTCSSPSRNLRSAGSAGSAVAPAQTSRSTRASTQRQITSKFKCPKCPSTLADKKNLDTHLRSHLMQGVTSRAPTPDQLLKEMPELVLAALNELLNEPVIGHLSQLCHNYVESLIVNFKEDISGVNSEMCALLSGHFSEILRGRKALFPSSISTVMYSEVNKLLSSTDFLVSISGFLTSLCDVEESVCNVVLGNFIFILSKKTLVFVIRTMRGIREAPVVERRKRSGDDINNIEFRQLVYHIGGCLVNGFLWKGSQYSETSTTWALFCEVLKLKFLRAEDKLNQCSEEVRAHTDGMDRGGLKHISDAAFDFFLILLDYLMSLEGDDGSLPAEVIDSYVLQNDVLLCLWDVLVGDYLSEMDSLDLLVQLSQKAVKVTIKGIMKRKLSEGLKKAYDSVALRARLAK